MADVTNQELRNKAGYDRMELTVMYQKWNWIDRTVRKPKNISPGCLQVSAASEMIVYLWFMFVCR